MVEFPEDAFESTGLLWAHKKWDDFDLGFDSNHAELSVIPMSGGQMHQLPKLIWVPPCCISLLISCRLTPRQFRVQIVDVVHQDRASATNAGVHWISWCIMACSIQDMGYTHLPILIDCNIVAPVTDCFFLGATPPLLALACFGSFLPSLCEWRIGQHWKHHGSLCVNWSQQPCGDLDDGLGESSA